MARGPHKENIMLDIKLPSSDLPKIVKLIEGGAGAPIPALEFIASSFDGSFVFNKHMTVDGKTETLQITGTITPDAPSIAPTK